MSTHPELYVVKHADWEPFVERRWSPAYEKYDDALDRLGLNNIFDINAGAAVGDGRVYCDEAIWNKAMAGNRDATLLLYHELDHFFDAPLNNHPTTPAAGFRHAMKVGFDSRAYTRLLRRKPYAGRQYENLRWLEDKKRAWRAGTLKAMPAPK